MSADEIQSIRDSLTRIEVAIRGDEGMGSDGIVKTQKSHGKRVTRLERAGIYIESSP